MISADSGFAVKDTDGDVLRVGKAGEIMQVKASSNGVALVSSAGERRGKGSTGGAQSEGIVISTGAQGTLRVALESGTEKWRTYRGEISLCAVDGRLRITETLPLEEYLCGVLKPEIGESAPEEALRAQAVAARTYAIRNLGRLADQAADLDDTTRTQSYLGVDGETPAICQAVQDTSGLIMTYDGQPIEAVYSTDCGGETAPGPSTEPYLAPVSDPDCADKPAWTKTYTGSELLVALRGLVGQGIDKIGSLSVTTTDVSGRAAVVRIVGENGAAKEVSGSALRQALGTDSLRSTLFTVAETPDGSFTFSGHGWGHGMGMCQQGAIELAGGEAHATYDEILKHYYTGIAIAPLTPALAAMGESHRFAAAHPVSSKTALSGGRS